MKQSNIEKRFRTTAIILCSAVLILWVVFYIHTARSMEKRNGESMKQVSGQVIKALESEFLNLEHMAFTLSQSRQVKEFVKENNPLAYNEKSAGVSELINAINRPSTFLENLIIYNHDNVYSRFMGTLGNTAASRVYYSIDSKSLPQHMVLNLEGVNYVGYASGIYDDSRQIGTVVLLMEEDKLQSLFSDYNGLEYLQISLAAGGKIITSDEVRLKGMSVDQVRESARSFFNRKIGVTPFEIVVSSDESMLTSTRNSFALTAVITAILFAVLLVLFFAFWNRYFFRPILSIMQGVEKLGTQSGVKVLKDTGEVNFDKLVAHINSMLIRLDEKNKALLETQFKLHNAEIEKQKSVIVSLKKQINAHFTVNVLNSIKRLAEKREIEKVSDMCDGLSFLLRYANAGDEFIGAFEEFFIVEKYIAIMSIRYRNKFSTEFDLDDRLDDIRIPRMLVQPIVENAILHGFKFIESGGILKISAVLQNGNLCISVFDNGCGMDHDSINYLQQKIREASKQIWEEQGLEHIALPNIQKRVNSYYGEGYGLMVDCSPGEGTRVVLTMPVKNNNE